MSKPPFPISEIPALTGVVTGLCIRRGRSLEETEIALYLTGELIARGITNPVEIVREIERQMDADMPTLMNDAMARRQASRRQLLTYEETGTKSGPYRGSPNSVHRSNDRARGHRWDLEEGGPGTEPGGA